MAIFYTDSGSFNDLKVSGSTFMSASRGIALQVKSSGSTIFSVSGSGGEIFNISDIGSSTALFTVASGSTTILNVDNTKNVSISGSLVVTGSAYVKGLGTTSQTNVVTIDSTTGQLYYTASSAVGGTASTPTFIATGSITASVNINTSSFQITSGSNTFLFISSSGNVGIGTTSPTEKLNVNGTGRFTNTLYVTGSDIALSVGNSSKIDFRYSNNSTSGYQLYQDNTNKFHIRNQNWGWNVMTFLDTPQSSGSVIGINNVSPLYTLDLSGSYTSGSLNVNNVLRVSGSNTTLTGSFAMSGSSLTIDIPSKANNYVLKSDANGGATWDSIYNIIGNYIYSGSVTASVNVATASYFQVASGSNQFFLVRDAVNLGYNWSGYSWSTNNSLSIYSSAGAIRIGTSGNNSLSLTTNASDRWQVNTSGHFVAGSENAYDIGTSTTGKVRNIYVTGSIVTTGSVTINDVLVLPYQNPLPSGKPTGSIATSGSGATFIGLYLYNGTSWVKLSV